MQEKLDALVKGGLVVGGSGVGVGILTVTEWLGVAGLLVTIIVAIVNWYYKREHFRLEQEKWKFEKESRNATKEKRL